MFICCRALYRCAKASQWGDRLPVKPNPELGVIETSSIGTEEILSSEAAEPECETSFEDEPENKEEIYHSKAPFSTHKDDDA